jgi:hypothetical protein
MPRAKIRHIRQEYRSHWAGTLLLTQGILTIIYAAFFGFSLERFINRFYGLPRSYTALNIIIISVLLFNLVRIFHANIYTIEHDYVAISVSQRIKPLLVFFSFFFSIVEAAILLLMGLNAFYLPVSAPAHILKTDPIYADQSTITRFFFFALVLLAVDFLWQIIEFMMKKTKKPFVNFKWACFCLAELALAIVAYFKIRDPDYSHRLAFIFGWVFLFLVIGIIDYLTNWKIYFFDVQRCDTRKEIICEDTVKK